MITEDRPSTTLSRAQVLIAVRNRIASKYNGSQSDYAEALGIHESELSNTLNGRRWPGSKILRDLNVSVERRIVVERVYKLSA